MESVKTKTFGLVGRHLTHSFSPAYFETKFQKEGINDSEYLLFPLAEIDEVQMLLQKQKNLKGFNVTIPYKMAIIPFLDKLSPAAQKIGAVNTVQLIGGQLIGHNTDVVGFERSLQKYLTPELKSSKALVLGTGGASKAVVYVLKKLGITYTMVSTTTKEALLYQDIDKTILEEHLIIINTTPLGMFPNVDTYPLLPYEHVNSTHLLFDLVYNPLETAFMRKGKNKGARVVNGLEMLEQQAEAAWEIWDDLKI